MPPLDRGVILEKLLDGVPTLEVSHQAVYRDARAGKHQIATMDFWITPDNLLQRDFPCAPRFPSPLLLSEVSSLSFSLKYRKLGDAFFSTSNSGTILSAQVDFSLPTADQPFPFSTLEPPLNTASARNSQVPQIESFL